MTFRLYHGGLGLGSRLDEIKPIKKGRAEFGAGLYLSNNVERALSYAKGSRQLYEVEVDLSRSQDLRDAYQPTSAVVAWVKENVSRTKQQEILDTLESKDKHGYSRLDTLNNLMINLDALTPKNSLELNLFLKSGGADYALDFFGGMKNEQVLLVIDPKIVTSIKPLSRRALTDDHYLINPIEPVVTSPRWDVVHDHLVRVLQAFESNAGWMGALHGDDGYLLCIDDTGKLIRQPLEENGYIDENEGENLLLPCSEDQWDNTVGNWLGSTEPHSLDFSALADRIKPLADYCAPSNNQKPQRPQMA